MNIVEPRRAGVPYRPSLDEVGVVCMWMPRGPRPCDDWTAIRIDGVRVVAAGELLIFERKGMRFGVPYPLICECSEGCLSPATGSLSMPAWYVRALALDDPPA